MAWLGMRTGVWMVNLAGVLNCIMLVLHKRTPLDHIFLI